MSLRDLLILIVVICVLAGLFGRDRVPVVYPGSIVGLVLLILVLGWLMHWF